MRSPKNNCSFDKRKPSFCQKPGFLRSPCDTLADDAIRPVETVPGLRDVVDGQCVCAAAAAGAEGRNTAGVGRGSLINFAAIGPRPGDLRLRT